VAHLSGKQLSIIAKTFLDYLLEQSKNITLTQTDLVAKL
jgi:hypothetical protein